MEVSIKPSDFDTKQRFMNTIWQNSERETIARNIVIFLRKHGDEFVPFTWNQYRQKCCHAVEAGEEVFLNALAKEGYLDMTEDGYYKVNLAFLGAINKFKKIVTEKE